MITSTLIISTFNRPSALNIVFESLKLQTTLPSEIIVADDGSSIETKLLINEWRAKLSVSLIHVWHKNQGFRLAKIRNQAIVIAKGEYIIQIDGDILLDKNFIKDHLCWARKGFCVNGNRVLLSANTTKFIVDSGILIDKRKMLEDAQKAKYAFRSLILAYLIMPFMELRGVIGCNMGFWKKDILAINGYDELFEGWGGEDKEMAHRLLNAGIRLRSLTFGGIAYHLEHPGNERNQLDLNSSKLVQTKTNKSKWTENGIIKS